MLVEKREEALAIPKSVPCTMHIWEMCQPIRRGIAIAVRVLPFVFGSKRKRNRSKIIFASKRNRGVCFPCFAFKQNNRLNMRNEKVNEAKRSKNGEAKRKKQSKRNKAKISEKNILKQNEGKTACFFFALKRNIKYGRESKRKEKCRSETKRKENYRSETKRKEKY
jgi:hypothetical protein